MKNRRPPTRRQVLRQRKAKTKANITCSNAKSGCKPDLYKQRQNLDAFDVREWFATDPSACVSDIAAQKILRSYEHPYRWWIKFPGKDEKKLIKSHFGTIEKEVGHRGKAARPSIEKKVQESAERSIREKIGIVEQWSARVLADDQFTTWWRSLRDHLENFLPSEVGDRFADYLSGFLLVEENETPRSSTTRENGGRKTNSGWRQLKKLLVTLNGGPGDLKTMLPPSTNPPHKESLKTKLIHLMSDELAADDYSRKVIADRFLPPTWNAIGETIRDSSFLRAERRSRQRTLQTK